MADTPGPYLARNAGLNIVTQLLTLAAPLVSVPVAVHALGPERFGILALGWLILGSSTLFDLGLGRAATFFVAAAIATGQDDRRKQVVASAFTVQVALGVLIGLILALFSKALVPIWSGIPADLREEASNTFLVLSVGVPISLALGAGRAALEGAQRFGAVNAVVAPVSILTYVIAALGAADGLSLPAIAALLVLLRALAVVAFVATITRSGLGAPFARPHWERLRELLRFGRWVAVGSVTGPLVVFGDRLIVSIVLGVVAVGQYSPPVDVTTRLWIIPGAVSVALFPYFSGSSRQHDPVLARRYWASLTATLFAIAAPALLLIGLGPELLERWLGAAATREAEQIVPVIAIGVLAGALGYLPTALVQGSGRPDIPVKLQLAELLPYLGLSWTLASSLGLVGAAVAWTLRAVVDFMGNWFLAERLVPQLRHETARRTFVEFAVAVTSLAALLLVLDLLLPFAFRLLATFVSLALLFVPLIRSWGLLRRVATE